MTERFRNRLELAGKVEWEGGLIEALGYGITADMMPEDDDELTEAWTALKAAYSQVEALARPVEKMLEEAVRAE